MMVKVFLNRATHFLEEALRDKEEAKANENRLREILKKAGIDQDL